MLGATSLPPPPLAAPHHVRVQASRTVFAAGDNLTVTCQAEGNPPPRLRWELPARSDWELRDDGATVTLPAARRVHGGTYRCLAQNHYGTGAASVDILFQGEMCPWWHPGGTLVAPSHTPGLGATAGRWHREGCKAMEKGDGGGISRPCPSRCPLRSLRILPQPLDPGGRHLGRCHRTGRRRRLLVALPRPGLEADAGWIPAQLVLPVPGSKEPFSSAFPYVFPSFSQFASSGTWRGVGSGYGAPALGSALAPEGKILRQGCGGEVGGQVWARRFPGIHVAER